MPMGDNIREEGQAKMDGLRAVNRMLREQNRVLRLEFQSLLNVIDDSYDEDLPVEIVEARNKAQVALTATSQPGGTHEL